MDLDDDLPPDVDREHLWAELGEESQVWPDEGV